MARGQSRARDVTVDSRHSAKEQRDARPVGGCLLESCRSLEDNQEIFPVGQTEGKTRLPCAGGGCPSCRLLSSLQLCPLTWLPSPKEVAVISSLLERPYFLCIRVPVHQGENSRFRQEKARACRAPALRATGVPTRWGPLMGTGQITAQPHTPHSPVDVIPARTAPSLVFWG